MSRKSDARPLRAEDLKRLGWRSIGPSIMGGRVAAMCFAPGNSKIYYVGYASGGLWVTKNRGTTFAPIFDKEETCTIGAVQCCDAPADWPGWKDESVKGKSKKELAELGKGRILWVGTGEGNGRNSSSWGNGVYRSTDAGKTWKHLGLEETHDIPSLAVDPRNPDVAYVAALGHLWGLNKERGLYKTEDGGKTWKAVLQFDDKTGCCEVKVDPKNPDIVFAAMYYRRRWAHAFEAGGEQGGIYRSKDAGKSWKKLGGGLPTHTGRIGLDIHLKDPSIVYAVVESHEGGMASIRDDRSKAGGVFRSKDGGDTWERMSVRTPRAFYFSRIYVDPQNAERVYLLGWYVEVSEDGGKTFRGQLSRRNHVDMHALLIDPEDTSLLINGSDGGVYQSFDRGETWDFLNTMATGQFYNVNFDMGDPYRVIGGLQDNGTWMGPSATKFDSLERMEDEPPSGLTTHDFEFVNWGDGFHAAFDPEDPNIVYAESQGGMLARRRLDTGQVKSLHPEAAEGRQRLRFNWNAPFFCSVHEKGVLYLGGNLVYKLTERGDKWQAISGDLSRNEVDKVVSVGSQAETFGTVVSLTESELAKGLLWAGTDDGLIHVTENDGKAWKDVTPAAVNGWYVSRLEASRHKRERAYASIDGHRSDHMDPLILMTDDLGASWIDITGDLPKRRSVMVVREDRWNPDVLYCGTEGGVFVTVNRGTNWVKLHGDALPTVPVYDIQQHPRERDLILGTHGRSIWILDDVAALSGLTDEVRAKSFHAFEPREGKPFYRLTRSGLWTDKVFRGPNPPMGVRFDYWIGEYQPQEVSISILNERGEEVAKLSGSNAPGLNRAVWDLKPKTAHALPDEGEDPRNPFYARSGKYTARITYGKEEFSLGFSVAPIPGGRV